MVMSTLTEPMTAMAGVAVHTTPMLSSTTCIIILWVDGILFLTFSPKTKRDLSLHFNPEMKVAQVHPNTLDSLSWVVQCMPCLGNDMPLILSKNPCSFSVRAQAIKSTSKTQSMEFFTFKSSISSALCSPRSRPGVGRPAWWLSWRGTSQYMTVQSLRRT